jgi:hypothetical protein
MLRKTIAQRGLILRTTMLRRLGIVVVALILMAGVLANADTSVTFAAAMPHQAIESLDIDDADGPGHPIAHQECLLHAGCSMTVANFAPQMVTFAPSSPWKRVAQDAWVGRTTPPHRHPPKSSQHG